MNFRGHNDITVAVLVLFSFISHIKVAGDKIFFEEKTMCKASAIDRQVIQCTGPQYHISLDSVTLTRKNDPQCSSILTNTSLAGAPVDACCVKAQTDTDVETIHLPTLNTNIDNIFKTAIEKCSFEVSGCKLIENTDMFTMNNLTTLSFHMVTFYYRCFPKQKVVSPCNKESAQGVNVAIFHGDASHPASSCQCKVATVGQTEQIIVHILYKRNTMCSLSIHDAVCANSVLCSDTNSAKLTFDTDMLYIDFNTDVGNILAIEITSHNGTQVKAECTGKVTAPTLPPCAITRGTTVTTTVQSTSVPSSASSTTSSSTSTSTSQGSRQTTDALGLVSISVTQTDNGEVPEDLIVVRIGVGIGLGFFTSSLLIFTLYWKWVERHSKWMRFDSSDVSSNEQTRDEPHRYEPSTDAPTTETTRTVLSITELEFDEADA